MKNSALTRTLVPGAVTVEMHCPFKVKQMDRMREIAEYFKSGV